MVSSIGNSTASSMMQRLGASQTAQTAAKVGSSGEGGTPPAGGGGAPPVAASGSSSSASSASQSSSTTKTYDPADTNQDGTVSAQELLAYLNAQASKSASTSQTQISDTSVTKQMLSQAYGNSSQSTSHSNNGTLSVTA